MGRRGLALATLGGAALVVLCLCVRHVRYERWVGPGPGGPCGPVDEGWGAILAARAWVTPQSGPLEACRLMVRLDRTRYLREEPLYVEGDLLREGPRGTTLLHPSDPDAWRYDLCAADGGRAWYRRPDGARAAGPPEADELRSGWSTADCSFVGVDGECELFANLTAMAAPPWGAGPVDGAVVCSPIAEPGAYTLRVVCGGVPDGKVTGRAVPLDPPTALVSNVVRFEVVEVGDSPDDDRRAYVLLQEGRQPDGGLWGTAPAQERAYRRVLRECPGTWYRPAAMYCHARCVAARDRAKGTEELLAAFRAYPGLLMTQAGLVRAAALARDAGAPLSPRAKRVIECAYAQSATPAAWRDRLPRYFPGVLKPR